MMRQLLPSERLLPSAADLEEVYAHPQPQHLRLNFVSSLDGAVEMDGRSGPLGGPADKAAFGAMRAVADVILVGAGTARTENYGAVRLPPDSVERRRAAGHSDRPRLAVVSGRGEFDRSSKLFSEGHDLLVLTTGEAVSAGRLDGLEAEVVACGEDLVEPAEIVTQLRRRGLGRILCEGGPALARTLMAAGLVDQLCLTLAPVLAGPGRVSLTGSDHFDVTRFRLEGLVEGDGLLLTRYRPEER